MITKKQSNKLKQLKYLVLVPLLGSMLLYSSCENNESTVETSTVSEAKKIPRTMYSGRKGEINKIVGETETYLDLYMMFNNSKILLEGEKIEYEDLLPEEKIEFDEVLDRYSEMSKKFKTKTTNSLFQIKGGRRVIVNQHTMPEFKKPDREQFIGKENIPFAVVDESPSFEICSGTEEEIKSCFNKELQKFVAINFNTQLASELDLSPGKKKVYIQFKIMKTGEIEIVGARAPHPELEEEARRVINLLPEIKPGKFDGKKVNVTYMLPISFNVEEKE